MQTRDTTSAAPSVPSSGSPGGSKLGKDDFLKLMMAQLSYQDPLEPMDSSAYLAQMAQFTTVEQLQAANSALEGLLGAAAGDQQLSAASLVGRDVVFENSTLSLQTGTPARGLGHLAAEATEVTALITDAQGHTVRKLQLGPKPAGALEFTWDGRDDSGLNAPPGAYQVKLLAADVQGKSVTTSLRGAGRVEGVSFEQGYAELLVGGARLRMADVVEIHQKP